MKYDLSNIQSLVIDNQKSLLDAMRQMDENDCKSLIVTKDGQYYSLISIGDIQRKVLSKGSLTFKVEEVLRSNITVASVKDSSEQIRSLMEEKRIELLPKLDLQGALVDVILERSIQNQAKETKNN